jgi:hypothetical protein
MQLRLREDLQRCMKSSRLLYTPPRQPDGDITRQRQALTCGRELWKQRAQEGGQ